MGPLSSGLAWLWLAAAAAAAEGESTGAPGSAEGPTIAQAQTAPAPPRTPGPASTGHTTAPAPARSEGTAPAPSRGTGPAPPPPSRVRPAPPGHPGYYSQDGVWYYDPYFGWAGWGLGWGFYPLYPEPPPPEPGYEPASPPVLNEIAFFGGPTLQRDSVPPGTLGATGQGSAGFSYAIEGERLGGLVTWDGLFLAGFGAGDESNTVELVTFNASWAFLEGASGRLRVEAGVSLAVWPSAPPYGSARSVGPDLGVSGRVALLGPFGFQGHARVTPFPRLLLDLSAEAVLRFGPVALTGGWRDLSLQGEAPIPSLRFAGLRLGLSVMF